MKRVIFVGLFFISFVRLPAQGDLKIISFDLVGSHGDYTISNRVPIDSIDVAPSVPVFMAARDLMYYVKHSRSGSEIVAFDFSSRSASSFFHSNGDLSSLAVFPDQKFLTWLRTTGTTTAIEKKSITGGGPVTVLQGVSWDAYCWIDDNNLMVVESGTPNTLSLLTIRPQKKVPILVNVGRTMSASYSTKDYAFIHKLSVDSWSIKVLQANGNITLAAETMPEAEEFTRLKNGDFIGVHDGKLFALRGGASTWQPLKGLDPGGEVQRVSVSESGSRMVVILKKKN